MTSETPEDEKVLNTHSVIACVSAIIAGTVLIALGHAEHSAIPFAFAFGVAALPQPVRGDR
jgi:uncharacterized membrane protein